MEGTHVQRWNTCMCLPTGCSLSLWWGVIFQSSPNADAAHSCPCTHKIMLCELHQCRLTCTMEDCFQWPSWYGNHVPPTQGDAMTHVMFLPSSQFSSALGGYSPWPFYMDRAHFESPNYSGIPVPTACPRTGLTPPARLKVITWWPGNWTSSSRSNLAISLPSSRLKPHLL